MTEEEKFVREELTKIYPQLVINIKKVCGAGYKLWGDDLLAVAVTFFLEKPLKQQLKTIKAGKLENFITWIANMQLKSNSSKFYNVYRKPNGKYRELYDNYSYTDTTDPEEFNEELMVCVEKALRDIPTEYRDAILSLVYQTETLTEVSSNIKLSIPKMTEELNRYIKKIQKTCEHCL